MAGSASASPTPQTNPPPKPLSADDQVQAALAAALNGTSSTTTDLYGLGQWKDQKIDPSGFPPAITLLLQQAGIDTRQPLTGAQLAQAISTVKNPALVSQIQQMLFFAGAYGTSVKNFTDLQNGTFGAQDEKALASIITSAGQTGAAFGTYLTSAANYGKANGILAAAQNTAQKPVTIPNAADENAVLKVEAHQLFGHDPSPDEYARFQAYFNTKVTQAATAAANAASAQILGLPDAATLGTAIGQVSGQFSYATNPSAPGQQMVKTPFGTLPAQTSTEFGPFKTGLKNGGDAAYQAAAQSQLAAQGVISQAASGAQSGPATITAAPDMSAAADAFLQQENPGAIGQQNVATKYATLLSILGG